MIELLAYARKLWYTIKSKGVTISNANKEMNP